MRIDIAGQRTSVGSVVGADVTTEVDPLEVLVTKSRETFELGAPTRAAESVSIERRNVSDETLVEIEWPDGLTWITRADVLAQDLRQGPAAVSGTTASVSSSVLRLDAALGGSAEGTQELTRDLRDDAAQAIENAQALRGETPDGPRRITLLVTEALGEFAGQAVAPLLRAFEGRVSNGRSGLYQVKGPRLLSDPIRATSTGVGADLKSGQPLLVLIHGAASSTEGTFGDLADTQCWSMLDKAYGTNIAAFEHATLTRNPIENAIELAKRLPRGSCIDLLTHSRGGLVGDLLVAGSRAKEFLTGSASGKTEAMSAAEAEAISELAAVVGERGLSVGRYVRVAAPSRGTLLLSKRLDTFVNLALTALSLATGQSPLLSLVKALVRGLVRAAADPHVVPGLACMRPDSPLIAFLNRAEAADKSTLAIVSGDARRPGWFGRLRTLIADLYFRAQHDLVVDTDSMYRGVRRKGEVHEGFHRDQGRRRVHHFGYFAHAQVQAQIADYLARRDANRLELMDRPRSVVRGIHGIGEIVGLDDGLIPPARRPEKPTVILIPGIMGSHLGEIGGDRIWLALSAIMAGGMNRLRWDSKVEPRALVDRAYGRLTKYLAEHWDVILYPFDWRLSVAGAGDELAKLIEQEMKLRERSIHIVAHSMGGLVARAMIARNRHLWSRLGQAKGRLVMLGTPNHGSYIIPKLLLGYEPLLGMLDFCDRKHDKQQLLDILRPLPGIYDMLPVQDIDGIQKSTKKHGDTEFFKPDFWKRLLPRDWEGMVKNLARAAALRDDLVAAVDPERMVYVAGKDRATPFALQNGALNGETEDDDDPFRYTRLGDGRVTWRLGRLPGVPTYYCEVAHGDLADAPKTFQAIEDLLLRGHTDHLPQVGGLRTASESVSVGAIDSDEANNEVPKPRSVDAPDLFPDERDVLAQALGGHLQSRDLAEEHAIELRFYHADQLDKHMGSDPILVGHYLGSWFGDLEESLDRRLGGALWRQVQYGVHPEQIGTSSVVHSTSAGDLAVVVMGLGESSNLSPSRLARSVRNALLRYVSNGCFPKQADESKPTTFQPIDIRTTLLGTGRGGLTRRASLLAIVEGALQANRRLREQGEWDRVRVRRITFADHVEEIVLSGIHEACAAAHSPPFHLEPWESIAVDTVVRTADPRSDYWLPSKPNDSRSGSRWHGITVIADNDSSLRYYTQGGRARADTIDTSHSPRSLNACIAELARAELPDDGLVRFLLGYLLPDQLRPVFREGFDLLLSLDRRAAGVPWELFLRDPDITSGAPVTRLSIVRQLRSAHNARPALQASTSGRALVIGEPNPGSPAAPLEGVGREIQAVTLALRSMSYDVMPLPSCAPQAVWSALGKGSYEIVHLAGHGFLNRLDPKTSGLMLQDGHVLGARELAVCDQPPSLLFVNACDLGQLDNKSLAEPLQMAASFAEDCIESGIRAVVVAGWKIQDDAAAAFAREFYTRMLEGDRLVEAVGRARLMAFRQAPNANSWAAFQCYGDPEFALPSVMDRGRTFSGNGTNGTNGSNGGPSPTNGHVLTYDRCGCWVYASEVEDELKRIRHAVEAANRAGDFAALTHYAEALSNLDRALPKRFRIGAVLFRLGSVWLELARRDAALAAFTEAREHPDCPIAVLERLSQLREAVTVAPRVDAQTEPAPEGQPVSGGEHRERRRKTVLERLKVLIKTKVASRRARVQFATVAWLNNDRGEAERQLAVLDEERRSSRPQKVTPSDVLADPEELLLRNGFDPSAVDENAVEAEYAKTVLASDLRTVATEAMEWLRLLRTIGPDSATSWTALVQRLYERLRTVAIDPDDPQRGRWGGQSSANSFELSATVTETDDEDLFEVELVVRRIPLENTPWPEGMLATFHLHPSFDTPVEVDFEGNEASLELTAWGAFTVGAEVAEPYTQLELDLSQLEAAPARFRER